MVLRIYHTIKGAAVSNLVKVELLHFLVNILSFLSVCVAFADFCQQI